VPGGASACDSDAGERPTGSVSLSGTTGSTDAAPPFQPERTVVIRSFRALAPIAALVIGASCTEVISGLDCAGGVDIEIGDMRVGALQTTDELDVDGAYLDAFSLRVTSEQDVFVLMESASVDAWLWLLTEEGDVIDFDDDSGGGTDAEIVATLPRGCYFIQATSFGPGETGTYALTVDIY
jgi:hypothetical protein